MIGLTSKQAKKLLPKYGYNETPSKKKYTSLKILISQFTSFLVIILIIAGGISIILNELIDGIAILAIVFINASIGFIQEYKAENAVAKLKKSQITKCIVYRDEEEKEIPVRELVPGDIIILNEGDKIPADAEILEAFSLKLDQSMLTGESIAVNKIAGKDLLYKETIIISGRGLAKVIATGKKTEFGKIINLLSQEAETKSPLAIQLNELGKKIGILILILILVLFILGFIRGIETFEMLMTSVALGVSAIPEGMPIIVTLTLAMGVTILSKKNAIVRKMNSIETLGATTVICSDKTGTLTVNEMTVKKIFTNFQETKIPGVGYKIKDKIKLTSASQKLLLEICENCNNSFYGKQILGDPTEIALKVLTRKAGDAKEYKKLDEKVFTSERKMMSTFHKKGNKKITYTKGAFEEVLKHCSFIIKNGKKIKLTAADKKNIEEIAIKYASQALRVLGMAYKEDHFEEKNLTFVGLIGMIDPPRKTAQASIKTAIKAGIEVKIITGDNALTAQAIAKEIGIITENIITGDEIDKLSDKKLLEIIRNNQIFARTKPEHKYRIVDLLQKDKEVVAVTGDGVNDAPALKHADVGVAMGIKGTEASKEVADIVLKDDKFSTIVNTIEEGRRIYHNILAFIKYMLSANFDTIMAVGILTLIGQPLPILPLQILWINIATDALPALALGISPASEGIMKEKPHPKGENIFKKFLSFILIAACIQTIANLIVFFYGMNEEGTRLARSMVFTQIVMFELFFVFVCKEEKTLTFKSFISNKTLIGAVGISFSLQLIMLYTPFMQSIFKTLPLNITQWALIIFCASSAFIIPKINQSWKKLIN